MVTFIKIICIGCLAVSAVFGAASYVITEAQAAMLQNGSHR
jgi:ribosomal protein S27E